MATVIVHHTPSGGPADPTSLVDGPAYDNDPHIVTGLENVDNTSDASKPVSTAQAAADAVVAANAANASNLTSGTVPAARLLSGRPIVIYADGQSNISLTKTFSWSPNVNAKIWNNTQDAVNTGTAFTALSSSTIGISEKIASDMADAFPTHPVYLIKNGYTGQAISHWLAATGAPDMYANGTANLVAALAAISVTKIDFYVRWQGEADQTPSINTSYVANFATMMGRYWGNSYFPRETPAIICGMSDTATSGSANADLMNVMLQACVNADPDTRRWVYTAGLSGATYWDATNPGHMTGLGYYAAGALASSALLNGPGRNTLPRVLVDPAAGKVVIGNVAKGSAFLSLNLNSDGIVLPTTGAAFDVVQADATASFAMKTSFGAPSGYVGRAAAGIFATPTALAADTLISFFGAQGYDGVAWTSANVANLKQYASELWSATAHGTYTVISNTKTGTLTQVDCLRVEPGSISIYGTTSGSIKVAVPAVAGSRVLTLPAGTTDFSATGGAGQYVKQASAGGAFTVGVIGTNEVSRAALAQGSARSVIGVTGNATANVADIQGTASQFLGVNSAGTALAFQTMSGDATLSGPAITVTSINGDDQTAAWTAYTPTVTSSSGSFTTVSATGRWRRVGKTVFVEANVTITTAGTAAGGLQVSLPFTAAAFEYVGTAIEIAVTAKSGAVRIAASGTTMNAFDASGTTFIAGGRQVTMTALYEIP